MSNLLDVEALDDDLAPRVHRPRDVVARADAQVPRDVPRQRQPKHLPVLEHGHDPQPERS